jgi:hypothetical protein
VSETEYRVVTRYISDTRQATPGLRGYGDAAKDTSRHLRDATASSMALGGAALRMVGTFVTLASVGYAIQRGLTATFRNLNEELNVSLSMAAQLNLAFQFSNDPGKNFATSLAASRDLLADIASDAAKLPGTATDYYRIASSISGAVFAAGGDTNQLRETTKLVGIAAPAAGQSQSDAANQAMRVLFGTASVGDNPLFAMMLGSQLFGPGMTTEKFNKLDPAERLEAFNTALEKIVTDDYLAAVVHTFDTQFGTLTESIVGSTGILAEIGGDEIFAGLLDGLVELNEAIEENRPVIVSTALEIRGALRELGDGLGWFFDKLESIATLGGLTQGAEGFVMDGVLKAQDWFRAIERAKEDGLSAAQPGYNDAVRRYYASYQGGRETFGGVESGFSTAAERTAPPSKRKAGAAGGKDGPATSKTVIHQTNNIQIDLKSDDSPEAVAVKVGEGMRLAARHPTMAARRPALVPAPRS